MASYAESHRLGLALMAQGAFAAAVQSFMAAITADPRPAEPWLGIGVSLARDDRIADLLRFVDLREQLSGEGFELFHRVLAVLATDRHDEALLAVWRGTPQDRLIHLPALYYAASVFLAAGADEPAFRMLETFKRGAEANLQRLPVAATNLFNIPYRQALLVEDLAFVMALESTPAPALPRIEPEAAPVAPGSDPVTLVACDARYACRFLPDLVPSFARRYPGRLLHLHVADSDQASEAVLTRLREQTTACPLSVSRESTGDWRRGAYYASCRFLIAHHLLDRYRRPLLIVDADSRFTAPLGLAEVAAAVHDLDFACFRAESLGPSSRCDAVITWFADNGRARRLLGLVRRFVAAKITLPEDRIWMLDQAALLSCVRAGVRWADPLRTGFINDLTRRPRHDFLDQLGEVEEKARMIRAADLPMALPASAAEPAAPPTATGLAQG